jgi:starch synthase (maltosyl-transferring)
VRKLNEIRRAEPALQRFENLRLLDTHGEHLFAYAKGRELVCVVNLDPGAEREDVVVVPPDLGVPDEFGVADLLHGSSHRWRVGRNYVRLGAGQAHVFKIGA